LTASLALTDPSAILNNMTAEKIALLGGVFFILQSLGIAIALRLTRHSRPDSLRPPPVPREFRSGEWKPLS
jgi:hypothetical protein